MTNDGSMSVQGTEQDGDDYGFMEYWDKRYRDGAIGDATDGDDTKLSNEWCGVKRQ